MLGSWEVVAQLRGLGREACFGYGSVACGRTEREYGTNDGDFAARLEDEDDWITREQPGARRLE